MDNNEALEIVTRALQTTYELKADLEAKLRDIQDPNIHTKDSKKKIVRRMRLVNNVIYTGEKAKSSLEADIAKANNPKVKVKRR